MAENIAQEEQRLLKQSVWICGMMALIVIIPLAWYLKSQNDLVKQAFPGDARSILESSQQFMLLTIDPAKHLPGRGVFHDFEIVRQKVVQNPATQLRLMDALYKGIRESGGDEATCFVPQHGIRATKDGRTVDVVICFHCGGVEVYVSDGHGHFTGGSTATSGSPEATFDKVMSELP